MASGVSAAVRAFGAALLKCVVLVACLALTTTVPPARAATPAPYPPTAPCALSIDSATLSTGHTLTVVGSGLGADLAVNLELRPAAIALGTAHTDGSGGFAAAVLIPTTLSPGQYLLVATSSSATCKLPASSPGPGPTGTSLPSGSTSAQNSTTTPATTPTGPASESGSAPSGHHATTSPAGPTTSAPPPTSPAPGAQSPGHVTGPPIGPILLVLALIALLVVGGSALMFALTHRRHT